MDATRIDVAERCLAGAHDGTMSFPMIVGALTEAGFEGYLVDYRRQSATYYLGDGDSVLLASPGTEHPVALAFDPDGVAAQVRWAQADPPGYSYEAFSRNVMAAGCVGYLVSFPGRRVVYFGRTGETHVEHFPS